MGDDGTFPSPQSSQRIDLPDNPATVERVLVIDPTDGASVEYEGSFVFLRDGGSFEVSIPVSTEPVTDNQPIETGPLVDRPIETLPDREDPLTAAAPEHILVAMSGDRVVASGPITAVGVVDEVVGIAAADPKLHGPQRGAPSSG